MTKIKPLTYVLIFAVVGLWGVIIYRIIVATFGDNTSEKLRSVLSRPEIIVSDSVLKEDTAKLLLNYRSPFVEQTVIPTKSILTAKLIESPKKTVKVATQLPNWNFINYSGFIRNTSSKNLIAIINVNSAEYFLMEGETAAGVKLLKNMRDSIKVSYNGQIKNILMNH